MRVFALSDIHADYQANADWVTDLSATAYQDDALIVAGDISHRPGTADTILAHLREKFAHVFFVPGNHDLWLREPEKGMTSLDRFTRLMDICAARDIHTTPQRLQCASIGEPVWVVPLHSWYETPEESQTSLFVPKEGEDPSLRMWVDFARIRWPWPAGAQTPARHFLHMNLAFIEQHYDAQVISFSHFLPRAELMFPSGPELRDLQRRGLQDPRPGFNFSRVAGTSLLDGQIRRLGATLHIYGHQHRNRCRTIDGVTYVSHCLGYPRERAQGRISGLLTVPRLVWPPAPARPMQFRK